MWRGVSGVKAPIRKTAMSLQHTKQDRRHYFMHVENINQSFGDLCLR